MQSSERTGVTILGLILAIKILWRQGKVEGTKGTKEKKASVSHYRTL
jgi:hypothetical protein